MLKPEELEQVAQQMGQSFGAMMDAYRLKMTPVFRCAHSGLFFPIDYLKMWGMDYGIGLGPTPVSEVLDTDYSVAIDTRPSVNRENIMHPVQVTRAQVDLYYAHQSELKRNMAITAKDDHQVTKRMAVILPKQWKNRKSQLYRFRPELESVYGPNH